MKKRLVVYLLICLLVSCTVFPVCAADMKSDGFGETDFINVAGETAKLGKVNLFDSGKARGYISDVWKMDNTEAYEMSAGNGGFGTEDAPRLSLEVAEEAGNAVMQVKQLMPLTGFATVIKPFAGANYDTVYFTFRFKIPDDGGSGKWFFDVRNGAYSHYRMIGIIDNTMYKCNDSLTITEGKTITRGEWYDACMEITATSARIEVYDQNGLFYEHERTGLTIANAQLRINIPNVDTSGYTIVLDDSQVLTRNASEGVGLLSVLPAEGAEEVSRSEAVELTLNTPITNVDDVMVSIEDENNQPFTNFTKERKGMFTLRIVPNTLLERKTGYKVTAGYSGTPIGILNFTTEDMHLVTVESAKLYQVTAGVETEISQPVPGTLRAKLSLKDPFSYPTIKGVLVAALYDEGGRLSWIDFKPIADVAPNSVTADFTISSVPQNGRLELMLLDDLLNYIPICQPIGFQ